MSIKVAPRMSAAVFSTTPGDGPSAKLRVVSHGRTSERFDDRQLGTLYFEIGVSTMSALAPGTCCRSLAIAWPWWT